MKQKITLLILLFLTVFSIAFAQEGTNDPTFNPSDTSIGSTVDGPVDNFLVQPDGKLIIYGRFEKYHDVASHYIVRINADKSVDASFNIGDALNGGYVTAAALQSDGKIIIAGFFTHYNNIPVGNVIRLNSDGSLDTSFTGGAINGQVWEIKVQADDKALICGSFTTYNNNAVKKVIRLNTDGSPDITFSLARDYNYVFDFVIQQDGKIVVPGYVDSTTSVMRRFNTDGTVDPSFISVYTSYRIRAIALQQDSKIVIGGDFETINGSEYKGIARINTNGTLDTTFNVGTGMFATMLDVAIQPDGKIIFVGSFTNYGDYYARGVIRFNEDGALDTGFNVSETDPDNFVSCVALTESNIYIGGFFTNYDNAPANYAFPLNYDGTQDYAGYEYPTGANNTVTAMVNGGYGSILIGGMFSYYNGQPHNRLALLNADGEAVVGFNAGEGPNGTVKNILRQSDGKYIIQGDFTTYNGVARKYVARINADGSLDTTYDLTDFFGGTDYYTIISGSKLQSDDKLILYGLFGLVNGGATMHHFAYRIDVDGFIDQGFGLPVTTTFPGGPYGPLSDLEILPDGKMLISMVAPSRMAKINSDGSGDTSFSVITGGANIPWHIMPNNNGKFIIYKRAASTPHSIYQRINENGIYDADFELSSDDYGDLSFIQGDGKMFFINSVSDSEYSLSRVNADGSPDGTYQSGLTLYDYFPSVSAVHYQEDKIVIGGRFSRYGGIHRGNIARINSAGALLEKKSLPIVKPSLIAIRKDNTIEVECPTNALSSVTIYDLSGRQLAKQNGIQTNKVSLKYSGVSENMLIVQAKLQDGKTLIKKIM